MYFTTAEAAVMMGLSKWMVNIYANECEVGKKTTAGFKFTIEEIHKMTVAREVARNNHYIPNWNSEMAAMMDVGLEEKNFLPSLYGQPNSPR